MARPSNKVLKYREQLDKLDIPYEMGWNEAKLKQLLDDMGPAEDAVTDEQASAQAVTDEQASVQLDAVVDQRVAALEAQLAEMKKMLSNGGSALTPELLREINLLGKQETRDGLVNPDFIKPEDELPEVRTYYRVGPSHNIFMATKAGVNVPLPYGYKCIKFEQALGYTTRRGNALHQVRVSTFHTKNRVIAEFIESLPEYGKTIHLERDKAMRTTVTGEFMELYNKHLGALQGQPVHVLTEMAAANGIPTSMGSSHSDYAIQLAEVFALREAKSSREGFEARMREFDIEKHLLSNV